MSLLGWLTGKSNADGRSGEPRRLGRAQHRIDPHAVSAAAVTVVRGLHDAGFEAFLVGGCVRDLLLGLEPKDFDVATNATPENVRHVFRRARLIGRRFRIAHVRVGRELIEVSTFRQRAADEEVTEARSRRELGDRTSARSADGLILRDNAYGTIDQDAFRRDFSINALYYDPVTEQVLDYVGGLDDIRARRLRLLGDPVTRFREDPVRILRAVRFAAKLGFEIEGDTRRAIPVTRSLIAGAAPTRLFDELCKLLLLGHAVPSWQLLREVGIADVLFPDLRHTPASERLIENAMRGTDQRVHEDKPVTPGFLFAILLWDTYNQLLARYRETRAMPDARDSASADALLGQAAVTALPKRHAQFAREVWTLQPRLEQPAHKSVDRLLLHPRFRAAYDFLTLRATAGEIPPNAADWWTHYQAAGVKERNELKAALTPESARRRRRRRRGTAAT
jgi:poly(A) polymerase